MKMLGFDVRVVPSNSNLRSQFQSRVLAKLNDARRLAVGAARRFLSPSLVGASAFQVRATQDGWMVAERGSSLPLRVFSKKADAIREAKKMAKQFKADVDIFTKQGELQNSQSYTH